MGYWRRGADEELFEGRLKGGSGESAIFARMKVSWTRWRKRGRPKKVRSNDVGVVSGSSSREERLSVNENNK